MRDRETHSGRGREGDSGRERQKEIEREMKTIIPFIDAYLNLREKFHEYYGANDSCCFKIYPTEIEATLPTKIMSRDREAFEYRGDTASLLSIWSHNPSVSVEVSKMDRLHHRHNNYLRVKEITFTLNNVSYALTRIASPNERWSD